MGLELLEREIRTNLTADGTVFESVLRDGERSALRFQQNVGGAFANAGRGASSFSNSTRSGAGEMARYAVQGVAISGALDLIGVRGSVASRGLSLLTTALSGSLGPIALLITGLTTVGFMLKKVADDQRELKTETEKATQALIDQAQKHQQAMSQAPGPPIRPPTQLEMEEWSKRYDEDLEKIREQRAELKKETDASRAPRQAWQELISPQTEEDRQATIDHLQLLQGKLDETTAHAEKLRQALLSAWYTAPEQVSKPKEKEPAKPRHLEPWEISESAVFTYSQQGQQLPGMQNMLRGVGTYPSLAEGMTTDKPKNIQDLVGFSDEHFERIKQAQLDEIERLHTIQQVGSAAYRGIATEAEKATKGEMLGRIQVGKLILRGYKEGLAAYIEAEGQKAAIRSIFELAESIAAYARGDIAGGTGHLIASGEFMAISVGAAATASVVRGPTGGGSSSQGAEAESSSSEDSSSSGAKSKLLTSGGVETNHWYLNVTFQGPVFYDRGLGQLAEDLLGYVRDMHEGGRLGREPAR